MTRPKKMVRKIKKNRKPPSLPPVDIQATPAPAAPRSGGGFWIFCSLWLAFCLVTLSFSNFRWLVPSLAAYLPQPSLKISLFLFIFMVVAIFRMPDQGTEEDLSKGTARILLLVGLGLGAFLRLYQASAAPGGYSIDTALYIAHVQQMFDLDNFQGSFIYGWGLLPSWPFTALGLWHLFPDASPLLIQRSASAVIDLAAVGVLYFAGKEMGGRRMGILTSSLAVVSKPLLTLIVSGYGVSPMTLGISLVILATLRMMKRPSLPRFLGWGAALGFLAYTVISFQPFIPFFIFLTFAWLLFRKTEGLPTGKPSLLVWATFAVLLVYYLHCLNAFSAGHRLAQWGDWAGSWILALALGAALFCSFFYPSRLSFREDRFAWEGWMLGSWLGTVLSFPVMTNEVMLSRIKEHALVGGAGFLSRTYLSAALERAAFSFQKLFWVGGDRSDMSIPGDAFFSYPEVILIALGLAFFLARPDLKKAFILLTALMGVVTHFAASETHSLRLIGCPPPFILLGALGLNELLTGFFRSCGNRFFRSWVYVLLAGFWIWSARGIFDRVYAQWAQKPIGNIVVLQKAAEDFKAGYRVYLAANLADGDQSILYESHPARLWHESNMIELGPSDPRADVVVLMGLAGNFKGPLSKAFPGALWTDLVNSDIDPTRSVVAYRCQIPFSALSDPRQKYFTVRRVAPPYWERTYTGSNSGLGFGFLNWEDKRVNINDPVPEEVGLDYAGVRYRGVIQLGQSGDYEVECKAINRAEVKIDGQKIFNLFFFRTGIHMAPAADEKKTLRLEAGTHRVEVTTCFQRSRVPPELTFLRKGAVGEGRSLWSSFDF